MAGLAGSWRRFIKEHQVATYCLLQGVTGRARNILMAAFERKLGLLVVKERGTPFVAVVA